MYRIYFPWGSVAARTDLLAGKNLMFFREGESGQINLILYILRVLATSNLLVRIQSVAGLGVSKWEIWLDFFGIPTLMM